jgi:hypothetical protein
MKAYPFIHKHPTSGQTTMSDGMDLRDYFAGMAMQALIDNDGLFSEIPTQAYALADAMMKQREVKHEQP